MPWSDDLANEIGPENRDLDGGGGTEVPGKGKEDVPTATAVPMYDGTNKDATPGPGTGPNTEKPWWYTINDPNHSLEQWKEGPLNIDAMKLSDVLPGDPNDPNANDPCYQSCKKKNEEKEEKCDAVRKRLEKYLNAIGCPSVITAAPQQQQQTCGYQPYAQQQQYQQQYTQPQSSCGCGGY